MENISKPQERAENPSSSSSSSPSNSPTTTTTTNNNGVVQIPSPKPTTPRSDPNNPYPTTFVQADTSNFKHVVQMLTGSTETIKQTPSRQPPQDQKNFNIPPKKQGFKLYERRNINNNNNNNNNNHNHNLKNSLMINTLLPNSNFSPRKPEILSPSLLNFPSLTLSPVTPLNDDAFNKSMSSSPSLLEEEKAIAEKGFYLHPSPRETTEPPQLLPLFPVTSPRVSGSAASS